MANKAVSQQWLYTENVRQIRYFSRKLKFTWNDRNPVLMQQCVMCDGWYELTILARRWRWRDVFLQLCKAEHSSWTTEL